MRSLGASRYAKTCVSCRPRRRPITDAATVLRTTNRSAPFLTRLPGTMKTEVAIAGTTTSHSQRKLQTSESRQPVLTANRAMSRRCSGNS